MPNFIDDFFENRGWLGLMQYNSSTGQASAAGVDIPVLSVATNADLPAVATTDGLIYVSFDPGDNGSSGLPADVYSDGATYRFLGGSAVIAGDSPNIVYTCPAATFVGTYTLADSSGNTSVSSAGIHGIETANQYVTVTAGDGWTLGPVKVVSKTDADTIVLEQTYGAGLGQPTFALAGSEFIMKRIKLPPLNSNSRVGLNVSYIHVHNNSNLTDTNFILEHVALGAAIGSATPTSSRFHSPSAQNTNPAQVRGFLGFYCANHATTKIGINLNTDVDATGLNNTGTEVSWTLAHTAETEILLIGNVTTADNGIRLRTWDLEVRL